MRTWYISVNWRVYWLPNLYGRFLQLWKVMSQVTLPSRHRTRKSSRADLPAFFNLVQRKQSDPMIANQSSLVLKCILWRCTIESACNERWLTDKLTSHKWRVSVISAQSYSWRNVSMLVGWFHSKWDCKRFHSTTVTKGLFFLSEAISTKSLLYWLV